MENATDVTKNSSLGVSEDEQTQVQETDTQAEVTETPETQPGSKTPPEKLLAALQEERESKKELQARLQEIEDKLKENESATPTLSDDELSDEGRQLKKEMEETRRELASLKESKVIEGLQSQYPALKDKSEEFNEFRQNYPEGANIEAVAKLFLSENDLLGDSPRRKGLEKPTGGNKTPSKTKMSSKEVEDLRKNNYSKYLNMLESGQLRADDIE